MRQNRLRIFHSVIIASLFYMALSGCGHKTDPVYVPDGKSGTVKGIDTPLKGTVL